jgi:anti-sigma factor RsiW
MSHISEGDLHAWLDGAIPEASEEASALRAHLATCAECEGRLVEERALREAAAGILDSATPVGDAPSFEDLVARAAEDGSSASGALATRERLRRGWWSTQRLGWAATIVLALGAGWIGRAVLMERGWTDPFHESAAPTSQPVETQAPEEESGARLEYFADDVGTESETDAAGSVREDRARQANEAAPEQVPPPSADARLSDAEPKAADLVEGQAVGEAEAAGVGRDVDAAEPRRAGELAQTREQMAEKGDALDEVADAPADALEMEARAKSVQPPLDPWHAPPASRLSPPPPGTTGCYRLEYSWSPGMRYLPGAVELTPAEARQDLRYAIAVPGGVREQPFEATWSPTAADSVWIQMRSGTEGEAFTIRAERYESGWIGEGRVLRPGSPVTRGQVRGPVRLVSVACERP